MRSRTDVELTTRRVLAFLSGESLNVDAQLFSTSMVAASPGHLVPENINDMPMKL